MTSKSRYLTAGTLSSASGQVDIDLKTGSVVLKGPAGNIVVGSLVNGDVVARIDAGHEVEPLQMDGVTLYGELACKLREVQQILAAHGAGELKLVKHGNEFGNHYLVIDGQTFIKKAVIDAQL